MSRQAKTKEVGARLVLAIVGFGCCVAACSDSVVVEPSGSSSGTSAGTTSGTTSGSPTGTPNGSPSGTVSGTPTGSGRLCGAGQPPCPPDEFCALGGVVCEGTGMCAQKPSACDEDCPGVCGCDGMDYCNACLARAAGTDVFECDDPGDVQYRAEAWPGGLDHIVIMRADFTNNTCIRVMVDAPVMQGLMNTSAPQPWAVTGIAGSDDASGCLDFAMPMAGNQAQLMSASGYVDWSLPAGLFYPCELEVRLDATFANVSGGLDMFEHVGATGVPVVNGCF